MSKLSLEQLQNNYRDREKPQIAEVAPVVEPKVIQVEIPVALAPVSSNKSSSAPLMAFLALSGMTMMVGTFMFFAKDTSSVGIVQDELVLGESTRNEVVAVVPVTKAREESPEVGEPEYVGAEVNEPVEELPVIEEVAPVEVIEIVKILPNDFNGVNLRISPNGRNKARAVSGEEFEFVSERDGWTEIRFDEVTTYWVLSELVEKL